MTFLLDVRGFVDRAKERANDVVRNVVIEVGTSIVMRTPVGNPTLWKRKPPPGYVGGRARGNWQCDVSAAPEGDLPDIDATGSVSIARITAAIPDAAAGKRYYLTNNLPYAMELEVNHHSSQAPNGMVGLAVLEFQQIVKAAVTKS
jgi:hypothetical protein